MVGVGFEFGFNVNGITIVISSSCSSFTSSNFRCFSSRSSRSSCSSSCNGGLYVFSISVIRLPVYILNIKNFVVLFFGWRIKCIYLYTNIYKFIGIYIQFIFIYTKKDIGEGLLFYNKVKDVVFSSSSSYIYISSVCCCKK